MLTIATRVPDHGKLTPWRFVTVADDQRDAFGAVLHAFSTYDSKRTQDGEPFARGINSFQLYSDGTRWWIVTIFWDAETSDKPIPAKYLSR